MSRSPLALLRGLLLMGLAMTVQPAWAQQGPRIAVTDLTYEEQVRQYFQYYEAHTKYDHKASSRERGRDTNLSSSYSGSDKLSMKGESSVVAASGEMLVIQRGELRKFTADIKGELLKSGGYRLVQGKPWTQEDTEQIYDIIKRIKDGYYPGADYVLFGTISNVEYRREANPIQGSNAVSHVLSLELVADFSLIDTKTHEIKAAFSAMGEGSDIRLVNSQGQRIQLNRSKVIQDVSRSLGEAVASEIQAQFNPTGARGASHNSSHTVIKEEKTIIFQR